MALRMHVHYEENWVLCESNGAWNVLFIDSSGACELMVWWRRRGYRIFVVCSFPASTRACVCSCLHLSSIRETTVMQRLSKSWQTSCVYYIDRCDVDRCDVDRSKAIEFFLFFQLICRKKNAIYTLSCRELAKESHYLGFSLTHILFLRLYWAIRADTIGAALHKYTTICMCLCGVNSELCHTGFLFFLLLAI